jgi:hypothetical protein
MQHPPEGTREVPSVESVRPAGYGPVYGYRAIAVIWFILGVVDVLIALRFLAKLFGASPEASFVVLLYGITDVLVSPFRGIFGSGAQSGFVFEPASLVAIVIYLLLTWGLVTLIRILLARRWPVTPAV